MLENIHSDRCLQECLARFAEQDEDEGEGVETKICLANALLGQFADEAIEPVRQLLLDYDAEAFPSLYDLRERLVAVATVMGVSFPEYDAWYAAAAEEWAERPGLGNHRICDGFSEEEYDEEWDEEEDEYWDDDEDEYEGDAGDENRRRPYGFSEQELVSPPKPQDDPYLPLKPITRQGRPARRIPGASADAGPRSRAAGTDPGEPGTADAGDAKGEVNNPMDSWVLEEAA